MTVIISRQDGVDAGLIYRSAESEGQYARVMVFANATVNQLCVTASNVNAERILSDINGYDHPLVLQQVS